MRISDWSSDVCSSDLALLLKPALLLADEPTGNLDSKSAADVLGLIDEVHKGGQTVVLVTHDRDVAAHAPREIRLRDGRIEDAATRCPPRHPTARPGAPGTGAGRLGGHSPPGGDDHTAATPAWTGGVITSRYL